MARYISRSVPTVHLPWSFYCYSAHCSFIDSRMGRSRSRSRERSRSRDRDRRRDRSRDRERERDRSRDRRDKKRRRRSSSNDGGEGHSLGSLLKKKGSRRSPVPKDIARELESSSFDASRLSEAAATWIEQRIAEQVTSRVGQLESAMAERITSARHEMEARLRAQIENEMHEEMAELSKKETESRTKCAQLERELEDKLKQAEESERKYNEERLSMLATKSSLERERAELSREKDAVTKSEQQSILNKGGQSRAPIKFKLGLK